MPKLQRTQWYDLTRDMNWQFKYVTEEEVFPKQLSDDQDIPSEVWWTWDEPYKISYNEYVHNQVDKDVGIYSVKGAISRSAIFEHLDPGWKSALLAHYAVFTNAEYQAAIGEARMGRFGRAAAWRNMATYGTLDELRHHQIQSYFSHSLLNKEPRADWAHKAYHTNNWAVVAARHLLDDMFVANEAVATAIQLTFTFETGFTNVQFLGLATDAMNVGDVEFGAMISSIQTDEARHAQQGEPTLRILIAQGKKETAQKMVDHMFWRSWRVFALLTGTAMDYYTPLQHRSMSFKEFMEEWIVKQFLDQFRDFGMEKPWYWDQFMAELSWYHHAIHLGLWYWRSTLWWNPDAGVAPEERDWLETKYPGWNASFGKYWDTISENIRQNRCTMTNPETFPVTCNLCQIPLVNPAGYMTGHLQTPAPLILDHNGRRYIFCSQPCKWIFEENIDRFAGHLSIIDRLLTGQIQPATIPGALAYMGLSPAECGDDATNYAWAFTQHHACKGEEYYGDNTATSDI